MEDSRGRATEAPWPRAIAHVDMDAFFASVEVRDDPSLKGRPVAVGGLGPRGVLATASYEARRFGVRSAMATSRAFALCPQLIVLPGRHSYYSDISREIMEALDDFSPIRETVSVDEAFLDLTGSQRLLGPVSTMARDIRQAVWDRVRLTCSVGAGISKSVAKIASAHSKPHGLTVVPPEDTVGFLAPLPIGAISGVGPVAQKKLANLGIHTVGELAQVPLGTLTRAIGSSAPYLLSLAQGRDSRALGTPAKDRSIGKERTFSEDITDPVRLRALAISMADEVSHRMRMQGYAARSVAIKMRATDGRTITRSQSFPHPCHGSEEFRVRALAAFERALPDIRRVRLLGVRAEHLVPSADGADVQGDLEGNTETWSEVDSAMDRARTRFGVRAIARATTLRSPDASAKDGTDNR